MLVCSSGRLWARAENVWFQKFDLSTKVLGKCIRCSSGAFHTRAIHVISVRESDNSDRFCISLFLTNISSPFSPHFPTPNWIELVNFSRASLCAVKIEFRHHWFWGFHLISSSKLEVGIFLELYIYVFASSKWFLKSSFD